LVELRPERLFRVATMTADLQFAELVCNRLARPRDVTIDLGRELVLGDRHRLRHILERLLAAPAVVMNASVDDQTRRAPDLIRQLAEFLIRCLVDANLPA